MSRRRTLLTLAVAASIIAAAVGERSAYALLEYPVAGTRPQQLQWVSATEVVRPLLAPLVLAAIATLLALVRAAWRRRGLWSDALFVALTTLAGWGWVIVAMRRMNRDVDAVLRESTIGREPPTTIVGIFALGAAAAALAVAIWLARRPKPNERLAHPRQRACQPA